MSYIGNGIGRSAIMPGQIQPGAVGVAQLDGNVAGVLGMFKNKIINGNFDIWQRGSSASSQGYLADRWATWNAGSTFTSSRQFFTFGQTSVPFEPIAFHRTVVTSVAGASNYVQLSQRIEGVRTFAGQNAVISFWAKADTSKTMAVELSQSFGTGGSPSTAVTGIGVAKVSLTSSWQQFFVPVNIPSISGKVQGSNFDDYLAIVFWFDAGSTWNTRTATLGQQSGTFDIAQVQIEVGTLATPFELRPIGIELLMCQRYFEALYVNGRNVYNQGPNGALMDVFFAATKRANPTLTYSGVMPTPENTTTPTAVLIDRVRLDGVQLVWQGTGGPAALTCGRMLVGGVLQFSAEF